MRKKLLALSFLTLSSFCTLATAVEMTVPQNEYLYVEYEDGFCPDNHCQLIYYKAAPNPINKDEQYDNYRIFASQFRMQASPDSLQIYNIKMPGHLLTEILAIQGITRTEFYPIIKNPNVIYSPLAHAFQIVGYDTVDGNKNSIVYPVSKY